MELTAVVKMSTAFSVTTCSPLKVNRRFGGTCRLHLHGRRKKQKRNQHEISSKERKVSRWRRHVPPKHRFTFNGLHDVISHKTELFITTEIPLLVTAGNTKTSAN
jgi:hypothetical protein